MIAHPWSNLSHKLLIPLQIKVLASLLLSAERFHLVFCYANIFTCDKCCYKQEKHARLAVPGGNPTARMRDSGEIPDDIMTPT